MHSMIPFGVLHDEAERDGGNDPGHLAGVWATAPLCPPPIRLRGYQPLFRQLESWLATMTGSAGISLQPNAGSQGEYAGSW